MLKMRLFALVTVMISLNGIARGQDAHKMTKADVERQIEELSNWGRWGKSDQLGALNLITPEKRIQAAQLVKQGICVSLARDVEKEPALDNQSPFKHEMLKIGRGEKGPWATDQFSVDYHGFAHTHMDSLCHLFYKGKLYNGFTRDQVGPQGAEALSIHNIKQGIFTRGILIDIPLLRHERYLEPGTPIYPEELDEWEKHSKIKVSSGDAVFICTGRWARRAITGPWSVEKEGAAGLHASCAKWLKDRDVAILGSDATSDVVPSQIDGIDFPIHLLTLHAMGVHIFDNCDLQALSQTAAKLGRWDFLLTAAPLAVTGGTGSPLNPIATY